MSKKVGVKRQVLEPLVKGSLSRAEISKAIAQIPRVETTNIHVGDLVRVKPKQGPSVGFQGIVVRKIGSGHGERIVVKRGIGSSAVERTFPLRSSHVVKIGKKANQRYQLRFLSEAPRLASALAGQGRKRRQ